MTSPPGASPTVNGITGTRLNAETKRALSARIIRAMKAADLEPVGWQVRSLMSTLVANRDEPTDEQVMHALMRAPWYPKPRRRHWRVGEGGGLAVR